MTIQESGKLQELKNKWWGGNSNCGDNQPRQNGQNMRGIQIPQSLVQQLRTLLMNIMEPPRAYWVDCVLDWSCNESLSNL